MKIPRTLGKYLFIFGMIFGFLLTASITFFTKRDKWKLKKRLNRLVAWWAAFGNWTICVHIDVRGPRPPENENFLIVSNHQSYLDILVQSVLRPSSFVTSLDIKRMPLLGQIVVLAGCLFVDRKNKTNIEKEIEELTEGLKHGLDVTIFPEATSTDGSSILRFRRPLYNAAIFSNTRILPVMLRYEFADGKPVDTKSRDALAWYGDMDFVSHLWRLLSLRRVDVSITYFDPIDPKSGDAQYLAETTHKLISDNYRPY